MVQLGGFLNLGRLLILLLQLYFVGYQVYRELCALFKLNLCVILTLEIL